MEEVEVVLQRHEQQIETRITIKCGVFIVF